MFPAFSLNSKKNHLISFMRTIYLLTDYKESFGSKWNAVPYRNGFNIELVIDLFKGFGFTAIPMQIVEAQNLSKVVGEYFVYTSTEDYGLIYKSFIEDVIYNLELRGANTIPKHRYLRATNNKVFMEMFRQCFDNNHLSKLQTIEIGSLEDFELFRNSLEYPIVIKKSAGALSRGVSLARNEKEAIYLIKRFSNKLPLRSIIKEWLRVYKYKGYKKESSYVGKIVLQQFIPNLKCDYKLLIFFDKYYVCERGVRKNDFRASGSGVNYSFGSKVDLPNGLLDYAKGILKTLNVPQLSLDIAYDGTSFYTIEYQAVHFGTSITVRSDGFYVYGANKWEFQFQQYSIEQLYVESIAKFIGEYL